MSRPQTVTIYRVTITESAPLDASIDPAENLQQIILDGLGYPDPESVNVEVEVIDAAEAVR